MPAKVTAILIWLESVEPPYARELWQYIEQLENKIIVFESGSMGAGLVNGSGPPSVSVVGAS